ncbi:MAG: alpha/beta fold hydrolase [Thermodesulfobacteriota bacterium]|nr:alpha/beta fold hydrolase [Thermodesulfobacteriota bacterium]
MSDNDLPFIAAPWPPEQGRKTILFIHGATMCKSFWHYQVEALGSGFNAIAVDLPGHGMNKGTGCRDVAEYAAAVMAFIDDQGISDPVLCGHSMGGAIAQHLLIKHPDRFPAAILVATGARLKVLPLIFETIETAFDKFPDFIFNGGVAQKNRTEALREAMKLAMDCGPTVAYGDFAACNAFDVMDALDRIKVPVLVVSGADDLTTPPKYSDYLAANLTDARLERIADAGHLLPMERPGVLNEKIGAFLQSVTIP